MVARGVCENAPLIGAESRGYAFIVLEVIKKDNPIVLIEGKMIKYKITKANLGFNLKS